MKNEHIDPFDVLKANDPARDLTVDPYDETADRILAQATGAAPLKTKRSQRRQTRRLVLIPAVVLLALLATAMVLLQREKVPTSLSIICYAEVGLDGHRSGVIADGAPDASDCFGPWQRGEISNPTVPSGDVPPLTACVTDFGALAVFPTDDPNVCTEVGLADPLPPRSDLEALSRVKDDITELLLNDTCYPIADALREFPAILDRHGLNHWQVELAPTRPEEPCTSVAYLEDSNTILIVRNLPPLP